MAKVKTDIRAGTKPENVKVVITINIEPWESPDLPHEKENGEEYSKDELVVMAAAKFVDSRIAELRKSKGTNMLGFMSKKQDVVKNALSLLESTLIKSPIVARMKDETEFAVGLSFYQYGRNEGKILFKPMVKKPKGEWERIVNTIPKEHHQVQPDFSSLDSASFFIGERIQQLYGKGLESNMLDPKTRQGYKARNVKEEVDRCMRSDSPSAWQMVEAEKINYYNFLEENGRKLKEAVGMSDFKLKEGTMSYKGEEIKGMRLTTANYRPFYYAASQLVVSMTTSGDKAKINALSDIAKQCAEKKFPIEINGAALDFLPFNNLVEKIKSPKTTTVEETLMLPGMESKQSGKQVSTPVV